MKKICHITTVHSRYDDRIFLKECISLTKEYTVFLIVADGDGDEIKDNVNIIDIGLRQESRIKRVRVDAKKALKKALSLNCDLYHFHDPELLTISKKLKKNGKKVIYDVHEDLPRQIYGKPYLSKFIQPILSYIIEIYENKISKKFDYIFTATPFIAERFFKLNNNTIDINNFPIVGELLKIHSLKEHQFCYTGGITEIRGIKQVVKAFEDNNVKLLLAGTFESNELKETVKSQKAWKNINYLGQVERNEVAQILSTSLAGIVTYLPYPNHTDAQPAKMFEYMSAGLAVIASNYNLWKKIIEDNKCGICVDPLNPKEISDAIDFFDKNPNIAKEMGQNGLNMIKTKYNWKAEEKKILSTYKKIFSEN